MKKIYILVLSILSVNAVNAQITLTAANNLPSLGDSFTSNSYDASMTSPGNSGANITWDFSSLISTGTSTGTLVAPSSLSDGANHPIANFASGDANTQAYLFIDNDEYSIAGAFSNTLGRDVYSDVREVYKFPITFGDSYNEIFTSLTTNMIPQTFNRGGTVTIEADGYGTLIMPYGTVNDVLRIKTTANYSDTLGGLLIATYTDVLYSWFNANTSTTILTHNEFGISGFPPIFLGSYLDPTSVITSLGDEFVQTSPILVYPNPARDQVTVSLDRTYNQAIVQIIDVTGKVVKTESINNGTKNVSLELNELDRGVYFVQVLDQNNMISTEKLMVN